MRATLPKKSNGRFLYFDFECTVEDRQQSALGYNKIAEPDCDQCRISGHECLSCSKCVNCNERSCNTMIHQPNFVVSQTVCKHCEDDVFTPKATCIHCGVKCLACWDAYKKSEQPDDCTQCVSGCGLREVIFKGDDTLGDFARFLFTPQHEDMTCIGHNAGRYDYSFLMEWLISETYVDVKTVYSGARLKSITIPTYKMRLIDSVLFFPMPLRDLPKCFRLESSKGDFPHLFNLKNNYCYIGKYPEAWFYDPDSMSKERRIAFFEWHANQRGKTFNFQKEILEYCRSDVSVLRDACTKYRQMIMSLTADNIESDSSGFTDYVGSVDPLMNTTTAGLCLNVFRTKFLNETYSDTGKTIERESEVINADGHVKKQKYISKTKQFEKSPIGIIPAGGYSAHDQFSR
jgi:hypothetical protein